LWFVEAGPATVRVKLGVCFKQKSVTTSAVVISSPLLAEQFSGVRPLGSTHSQDVIFELVKLLLPLLVSFKDFVFHVIAHFLRL
jgi:hypothetical protein